MAYLSSETRLIASDVGESRNAIYALDNRVRRSLEYEQDICIHGAGSGACIVSSGFRRGAEESQRDENRQLAEATILYWIFQRSQGTQRPVFTLRQISASIQDDTQRDPLNLAIRRLRVQPGSNQWIRWRREYWEPQLAMILVSELDDPLLRSNFLYLLHNHPAVNRVLAEVYHVESIEDIPLTHGSALTWGETNWENRDQARLAEIQIHDLLFRAFLGRGLVEQQEGGSTVSRYSFSFLDNPTNGYTRHHENFESPFIVCFYFK